MQFAKADHTGINRLRCILDGKVVSLSFAADMAFGDVAHKLDELSARRYGKPIVVDVTLAAQH